MFLSDDVVPPDRGPLRGLTKLSTAHSQEFLTQLMLTDTGNDYTVAWIFIRRRTQNFQTTPTACDLVANSLKVQAFAFQWNS